MVFNVQAAFAVKSGDCAAKSNADMAELADAQDLEFLRICKNIQIQNKYTNYMPEWRNWQTRRT